jgi:hypothetical protein
MLTDTSQSLRSQEASETYLNKTSAVKKSSIICAASLAAVRLGRHMLLIHPPENLKAIAYVNFLSLLTIVSHNVLFFELQVL